jgi:hypothetical protein
LFFGKRFGLALLPQVEGTSNSEGVKKLKQRKKWFLAQRGVGRLENFTA